MVFNKRSNDLRQVNAEKLLFTSYQQNPQIENKVYYQYLSNLTVFLKMSKLKLFPSTKSQPKQIPARQRLSKPEVQQLKSAFDLFDEDNSGKIDPKQIQKILQELGLDKRNQIVFNLLSDLQSKETLIDFDEFLQFVYGRLGDCKTSQGLLKVFTLYDNDMVGQIDFEKMKIAAKQLGQTMTEEDIIEMMHNTHILNQTESNQTFSYEQFYEIVTKKKY